MFRKSNRLQSPRWSLRRRPRCEISQPSAVVANRRLEPDYYKNVPKDFHIIGFDGSGTVVEVGPDCEFFKPGDEVSYVRSPTRQGSNAEYQLINEFSCALKPKSFDFVQAASYGLTFGTAYQSLHDRLEIKPGENVGILIVRRGSCFYLLY
jgi:NADPH:quinone reductase-like Zn-dependent oxidoreductase